MVFKELSRGLIVLERKREEFFFFGNWYEREKERERDVMRRRGGIGKWGLEVVGIYKWGKERVCVWKLENDICPGVFESLLFKNLFTVAFVCGSHYPNHIWKRAY